MIYQIQLQGQLGQQWTEWFDGLNITLAENGDTRLTGPVVDQAALHGLLRKVRDLKALFASVGLLSTLEIALPLWLLMKGINVEQWKKRALAPA